MYFRKDNRMPDFAPLADRQIEGRMDIGGLVASPKADPPRTLHSRLCSLKQKTASDLGQDRDDAIRWEVGR